MANTVPFKNTFRGIGFYLLALVGPLFSIPFPRSFTTVFVAAAIISLIEYLWATRTFPRLSLRALAAATGLSAYMSLTALWALDVPTAFSSATKFYALALGGMILYSTAGALTKTQITLFFRCLAAACGLAMILIITEDLSDYMIYYGVRQQPLPPALLRHILNREAMVLSALLWPVLFFLNRWRPSKLWLLLPIAFFIILINHTSGEGAMAGLFMGYIFFLLALETARYAQHLLRVGIVIALLTTPWIVQWAHTHPPTTILNLAPGANPYHRLEIWDFVGRQIDKKPILGWGVEAARNIPSFGETTRFNVTESDRRMVSSHPHNNVLHIWLDFGVVGIVAALSLLRALHRRILAAPAAMSPYMTGQMATLFTISCVSHGLWQTWWIALLLLTPTLWRLADNTRITQKS